MTEINVATTEVMADCLIAQSDRLQTVLATNEPGVDWLSELNKLDRLLGLVLTQISLKAALINNANRFRKLVKTGQAGDNPTAKPKKG